MVYFFMSEMTSIGQSRPFHAPMPTMTAMEAYAGSMMGMMMRKKMPYSVQPSTRPASSRSPGMPSRNWRKKNTALMLTRNGSITPA